MQEAEKQAFLEQELSKEQAEAKNRAKAKVCPLHTHTKTHTTVEMGMDCFIGRDFVDVACGTGPPRDVGCKPLSPSLPLSIAGGRED